MTTKKNSPCLLSNNEPCYIASSLKQYLCKEYNIRIYLGQGEKIKKTPDLIKKNSINKRLFNNKTIKFQNK